MNPLELRKSHMDIGKLYFWAATINDWNKLLEEDELKEVIISSLKYLVTNKKIEIYAFVIMPNHVHFVWQLMKMNGKEQPHASLPWLGVSRMNRIDISFQCCIKDGRRPTAYGVQTEYANHLKVLQSKVAVLNVQEKGVCKVIR